MLDRRFPQETIAKTITSTSARIIPDPGALDILDASAIETMATAAPDAGPLRTVWCLSRTAAAAVASNEHLALPESGLSADSFKRADTRYIWPMERRHPNKPLVRLELNAHPSFGEMGPSRRIELLKRLKTAPPKANRFIKDNTQRNSLKQIHGSLLDS